MPITTKAAAPFSIPSAVTLNTTRYKKYASGKLRTIVTMPQTVSQTENEVKTNMRITIIATETAARRMSCQKVLLTC